MRVLVYEHLCSLPTAGGSLRAEGRAMLAAALADLAACPGIEAVTLVEPSLVESLRAYVPGAEVHAIGDDGVEPLFRRLAREAAYALVIAPEFDDLLATRCEWALEEGIRLLGPAPEAVRLCADKLRLTEHLREQGMPAPLSQLYEHVDKHCPFPCICKPRFGAGAQATYLVYTPPSFRQVPERARQEGWTGPLIVQPACAGTPASVAFLIGPKQTLFLAPCEQRLEGESMSWPHPQEGRLRYRGGQVPLRRQADSPRLVALAVGAISVVPGLTGYVGVDVVHGWDESGRQDVVIEINPRLTTSYVGLRRLARGNLMQSLLDVVQGKPAALSGWHEGPVRFDLDGTIH
jgi:predicted ATP-grasp superfamily ATP-dependent carboligase